MIWITPDEINANEKCANDIARGIANSVGAAIVDSPSYGYGGAPQHLRPRLRRPRLSLAVMVERVLAYPCRSSYVLMTSSLRAPALMLLVVGCCAALGCSAATRKHAPDSPQHDLCSTSRGIVQITTVSAITDLARIERLFTAEDWSKNTLKVTSARSLSGECVSKLDGYDGSNLSHDGGTVVRTLNSGLQEVPQGDQGGIYDRLYQRAHNSPGAPSRWSAGSLVAGVHLGAARCPATTGVHLASWKRADSTVLGVYARNTQTGTSSGVSKLTTVNGTVRSLGFLPSADTDDGQVFLSIENGAQMDLVTARLTGTELLTVCP